MSTSTRRIKAGISPLWARIWFVLGMAGALAWLIAADPTDWEKADREGKAPSTGLIMPATPSRMGQRIEVFVYDPVSNTWSCQAACLTEDSGDWACEFSGNGVCTDRRRGPQ